MANIQGALCVAILLLIWIVHSESACPDPRFLKKHVCAACNNENSALDFSKPRGSGINTVFTGSVKVNYQVKNNVYGEVCDMDKARPTFQCNLDAKKPYCKYLGNKKGFHATSTGHLFYKNLV